MSELVGFRSTTGLNTELTNANVLVGELNYGVRGPRGPKGDSYPVAGSNINIVNNVISVITTDSMEQDNTKPITSGGVYTVVGNIEVLLGLI